MNTNAIDERIPALKRTKYKNRNIIDFPKHTNCENMPKCTLPFHIKLWCVSLSASGLVAYLQKQSDSNRIEQQQARMQH